MQHRLLATNTRQAGLRWEQGVGLDGEERRKGMRGRQRVPNNKCHARQQ